ncbi:sugar porter family MFS transporter [Pseudomassariella vexata]|uniref:Sugar porter family MFS transporter n=1 Tax=Pseudomassariella vexata TaxID=1141098 RepID=A0A1Y2DAL6_9PEZI|nr:sugar porter family MFS transporter [Pseudomassariella vexata]ORY56312.1 sugar porter family MFS transporter [Pseudomassariella vexata]
MAKPGDQTSRYNRLVIAFVALGSTTYGYGASVIGSTIGQPGWYTFFQLPRHGEPGYGTITTPVIATANGIFSAGAAVACLVLMWSGDCFGRVRNIQAGCLLGILGGVLQGGAVNLAMLQTGRFIMGTSIGIMATMTPMYLSEMSSPLSRGWLVGQHAIFLVFGYMLSAWIGYGLYFLPNTSFSWRFPLCFQVFFPLVLLAGSPWVPPSPRWLISKGRHDEAWGVLVRLRRSSEDPDDLVAKKEFRQIKEQLKLDHEKLSAWGGSPWKAVFAKKSYRKRMIIGFLTQWGAEFGGPLIINNYSVILYQGLGQTRSMPLLLSALWLTTAGVIYNPGGAWLHDKLNSRRWMFMTGFTGIAITTSGLTAMIACFAGTDNKVGNAMGVVFMFLYLFFQGTFCDTTMYIYVSEIFPTEIRSIGMGWSLFGQFSSTIILLQTAPIGFAAVGWKYFLLVICWSVVFVPIIYFYFPETARMSLEELEKQFGDEVAVHDTTALGTEEHSEQ